MPNIVVSLSGGLDSTTCLAIAKELVEREGGLVEAVSFNYGQRHSKELERAKLIAETMGIRWNILDMPHKHLKSALLDEQAVIPSVSYEEIEGMSPAYVPFRNGLMLALLAGYAASYGFDYIMAGPHAEDADRWAYADCTLEFMGSFGAALYIGTYGKVRLLTPLLNMTKAEVVEKGSSLGAPLEHTWSCYIGGEKHCGVCPTCRARKEAFAAADIVDPTAYEV